MTPNPPHNFWPHPLGGIIGLFHSVGEITICLPYHKKFVFLGHTLVYMEYYREFYEACTRMHRHSRVPIPLGADPENHSFGRYTSSWFILDVVSKYSNSAL